MSNKRTTYTAEYKAKIAMLAIGESMTIWEISSKYSLHSIQISKWKKELQNRSKELFEDKRKKSVEINDKEIEIEQLYKQLWKLTVENDWLKKKSGIFTI